MTRAFTLTVAAVLAGTALLGQAPAARDRDDVRLQTAINTELIDGDLRKALTLYGELTASTDRAVAAEATLRLGLGYQRLGDPRMTGTLERVLEFPDHPAIVARARTTLAQSSGGAVRTLLVNDRRLNLGYPAVSADGRYLAYTDFNGSGHVSIRDLTTGVSRPLTNDGVARDGQVIEYAWDKSFSPDGRRLVYSFNERELRLVDVVPAGLAESRVVFRRQGVTVYPGDWSADGRRVAMTASRWREASEIGYVTIDDGEFHVVRTLGWVGTTRLSISPDGAYLAYDVPADNGERDVHVVATSGAFDVAVASDRGDDRVFGWAADGRHLLLTSDRSGTVDLYARPMRNGRPDGDAVRLQSDVLARPIGITRAGDVLVETEAADEAVAIVPFDPNQRRVTAHATRTLPVARDALWLPGSQAIVHRVELSRSRGRALVATTNVGSGRRAETAIRDLRYFNEYLASDGRTLIVRGASLQGAPGLHRVDLQTGETTTIELFPSQPLAIRHHMSWWEGTSSVAYLRSRTTEWAWLPGIILDAGPDEPTYVERDLATNEERPLFRFGRAPWSTFAIAPSPDRRQLASRSPGRGEFERTFDRPPARGGRQTSSAYGSDQQSYVYIHTIATGETRRLWSAPFPKAFSGPINWLPDGSAIIVTRESAPEAGRLEAWMVPIDGSEPQRLDVGVQNIRPAGVRLSPDGRRLAVAVGDAPNGLIQVYERAVPGSTR